MALAIKHKVYEGEFLMTIVDLMNEHGLAFTLGECLEKAIIHFLHSINNNLKGEAASTRVERDQQICAGITALTVFANCCIEPEYMQIVVQKYID
jgi:hypothetical protein